MPNMPIVPTLSTEPLKPTKPQKVSLPGYEHFDRMVENGKQEGIEVTDEWKIPLLKELDNKIYNPSDEWDALGLKYGSSDIYTLPLIHTPEGVCDWWK